MSTLAERLSDRGTALSLVTFAMLLGAFGSVNAGMALFVSAFESIDMLTVVIFAVLTGWVLGRPPISWRRILLPAGVLGLGMSIFFAGRLAPLFGDLLKIMARAIGLVLTEPESVAAAGNLIVEEFARLGGAMGVLMGRVLAWVISWSGEGASYDPVVTAFIWSLVIWTIGCWGGLITRGYQKPLVALTPGGAVLALGLSYSLAEPIHLFYFLAALLFLIVISRQVSLEKSWSDLKLDFPEDIAVDHFSAGAGVAIVLLAISLVAPSISVRPIASFVGRLTSDMMRESVGFAAAFGVRAEPQPANAVRGVRLGGMPRDHLIGSGPELEKIIVMTVQVEEGAALAESKETVPFRYYWRAVSYDEYNGRGWSSSPTRSVGYRPGETVVSASLAGQTLIRQKVHYVADFGGLLHVSGHLVAANETVEAEWRSPPPQEIAQDESAVALMGDLFGVSTDATDYEVQSLVARPGRVQLLQAKTDYPGDVSERYLQLPPDLPQRVQDLASELTINAPTGFEKAIALETYLRSYPYNLDLPAPPADRDVVDYFLFDLRQGYCDYYATSMVVLARSIGLPARVVVGYASGSFDQENRQYVISAADAHSWVEIFFPDYGWVEFEPTGNRPVFERQEEALLDSEEVDPLAIAQEGSGWISGRGVLAQWSRFLAGILLVAAIPGSLLLVWAVWPWLVGLWLRAQRPEQALTAILQGMYKSGQSLGISVEPGLTAFEFSSRLISRWDESMPSSTRWLPPQQAAVQVGWLVKIHGRALFSKHPIKQAEQQAAIDIWGHLIRQLWLLRIRRWLQARGLLGLFS